MSENNKDSSLRSAMTFTFLISAPATLRERGYICTVLIPECQEKTRVAARRKFFLLEKQKLFRKRFFQNFIFAFPGVPVRSVSVF
jgi:hypothetical protein